MATQQFTGSTIHEVERAVDKVSTPRLHEAFCWPNQFFENALQIVLSPTPFNPREFCENRRCAHLGVVTDLSTGRVLCAKCFELAPRKAVLR